MSNYGIAIRNCNLELLQRIVPHSSKLEINDSELGVHPTRITKVSDIPNETISQNND
jgi:hypothetical protein